jgi:hypothetical protein
MNVIQYIRNCSACPVMCTIGSSCLYLRRGYLLFSSNRSAMQVTERITSLPQVRRVILLITTCWLTAGCHDIRKEEHGLPASRKAIVEEIKSMHNGTKWSRCFRFTDGYIYFKDSLMSKDAGKTLEIQKRINLEEINGAPERAVFSTDKLFYALDGPVEYISPGKYKGRSWQSRDNLNTVLLQEVLFSIPDGAPPIKNNTEWYGLFVYRTILRMPGKTWLMTMYGNFKADTLVPYDSDAKQETRFMQRTFIVTSQDEGHTWNYLSTVAAPSAGDPVAEGFVEPAITLLNDGRLLCIMRSGHHYPLYASWSSDQGRSWTSPVYTGLDRGCDPCLITLHDGRVALSWGRRFPEGWSEVSATGDKGRYVYPGEGYTNLAISEDGGLTWVNQKIIQPSGSCYSTIFETEPGVIFMQSDQWYCQVILNPAMNR